MKYMGSKRLIAKELLPFIDHVLASPDIKAYVEPFVGGCNMIDKVSYPRRYGFDNNRYLIAMLSCLDVVDKEMPDEMPREEYEAVRADYNAGGVTYTDWYIGAVGFLASRSGRFFDGGFSGIITDKDGKTRNHYLEAKRNVLAQAPLLRGVKFGFGDYRDTCSKYEGALIYCDPPYKDVKAYSTSRGFDHAAFWDWCRAMAEKNIVLVSEQTAPDEPWIEPLWQKDVKRAINHSETKESTEKLFLVRGEFYDKHMDMMRDSICIGCKAPKDMLFPAGCSGTAADYGMPEEEKEVRYDMSCPELAGPFRNEQDFKNAWLRRLRQCGEYLDVFEVENEEKVPGFPDVLCIRNDGRAEFHEMKLADKSGRFRMERTQPRFYTQHPNLSIAVVVWYNGSVWMITAQDIALRALESVSVSMSVNDFREVPYGPKVPHREH